MAAIILQDCYIKLDAVDYSGEGTNVALALKSAAEDVTAFGDTTKVYVGGTKEWSLEVEVLYDATNAQAFDAMLGTVVPIEVRATSAAVSVTNPSYQGDALLTEWRPFGGSVGDLAKASLVFTCSGPLSLVTA